MQITYLHHACVLLQGTITIIIDPFIPDGTKLPEIDICAVTHGHGDHLGIAESLKCTIVTVNEIAKYLERKGCTVEPMNIGGTIEVKGVTFTMTWALHSSLIEDGKTDGIYGGNPAGFIITLDNTVIYYSGDTGLFGDMKLIGELYHPDIAILPIGGRYTMGPREAMMAANFIGAPIVIPVHYNTNPLIKQDVLGFKEAIEKTTPMKVIALKPGESWSNN